MATQTTETTGKGRNRNLRKGATTPELVSIGNVMAGKDQTPAVKLVAQADPKDVEGIKLDRKTLDKAAAIIGGFHKASDELQSLKDDVEKKRGGLSDICFQLAVLGAGIAIKPEHRLAAVLKVFDSAEAYERQRYQKANKLAEIPASKVALGSSWQTYKSQILKGVRAGLNPLDFKNGTVFREATSHTGNKARRSVRTTTGALAAGETTAGVLESAKMRTELSAAIADLVEHVAALSEEAQLDYANRIHRISIAAAKAAAGGKDEAQAPGEQATATM